MLKSPLNSSNRHRVSLDNHARSDIFIGKPQGFRMLWRYACTVYREQPRGSIALLVPVSGTWEARQLPGWYCRGGE